MLYRCQFLSYASRVLTSTAHRPRPAILHSMPVRIVIIGAGFVGLPAARTLKARLGNDADVLLIDRKDHFLFAPRLVDALAGDVREEQIMTDLRLIADRCDFRFLQSDVERIDRKTKEVILSISKIPHKTKRIPYDILILGQGARTTYFGVPGSEEFTVSLKQIEDVYQIHERVHECVDRAKRMKDTKERRAALSFVVVGGGASGVETVFALMRYLDTHLQRHAPKLRGLPSYTLLDAGPQILNGFPPRIVKGAMKELERNKIRVMTGAAVSCVENLCVIRKEERMPSAMTIWAAGVLPNVIPITPEVHRDSKGCFITDHDLRIDPSIFAAGDAVTHQSQTVTVPKNAQTAMRMSRTIVENVIRTMENKPLTPFTYTSLGTILVTGSKGFVDLKAFQIKTRLAALLRDGFYRYRHWQITRA